VLHAGETMNVMATAILNTPSYEVLRRAIAPEWANFRIYVR